MTIGNKISIIPAGEQWEDGSIRFALEDLIGAGAIISFLSGKLSPESENALNVYNSFKDKLYNTIVNCISGKELAEKGFEEDIKLAAGFNMSKAVPILKDGGYMNAEK